MFDVWHRDKLTKHTAFGFVTKHGELYIVLYENTEFVTKLAENYRLAP